MRSYPASAVCRVGPLAVPGPHDDEDDAVIEESCRLGDLLDAPHRVDEPLVEHDGGALNPTPAQFVAQSAAGDRGTVWRAVANGDRRPPRSQFDLIDARTVLFRGHHVVGSRHERAFHESPEAGETHVSGRLGPQLVRAIHNRLAAQLRGNHRGQQGRQVVGLVDVRPGAERGNDRLRQELHVQRHVLHGRQGADGGGLPEESVEQAARPNREACDPESGHQHLGDCGCGGAAQGR